MILLVCNDGDKMDLDQFPAHAKTLSATALNLDRFGEQWVSYKTIIRRRAQVAEADLILIGTPAWECLPDQLANLATAFFAFNRFCPIRAIVGFSKRQTADGSTQLCFKLFPSFGGAPFEEVKNCAGPDCAEIWKNVITTAQEVEATLLAAA